MEPTAYSILKNALGQAETSCSGADLKVGTTTRTAHVHKYKNECLQADPKILLISWPSNLLFNIRGVVASEVC